MRDEKEEERKKKENIVAKLLLILLAGVFFFSACSINKMAVKSTSRIIHKGLPAMFSETDLEFARESMPANLKLIEMLIQNEPSNTELLVTAAHGFCGYSFMFIEDEDASRASKLYEKGAEYALAALKKQGIIGKNGDVLYKEISKNSAPAAFWHSFCRLGLINLNRDEPEALAELPRIIPAAEKILAVRPEYYYNGADVIMGVYYAIRPKLFGGNPGTSKKHFEASLAGNGRDFLMNKYLYAKTCAVSGQDAELFEKLLMEIIASPPLNPQEALANEAAKAKAKKLLEKKDELF
ncbi:MAG: hypothetical protein HY746_05225 [Elusimicrobia bacterium]|nr:hypothetical protein [Elusimicrobiota bacterium]